MNRAFQKGFLAIDFPAAPFRSPLTVLLRSASVFFGNFPFIAAVTLAVFLPVKAAIQLLCWMFDVSTNSLTMYLLLDLSDLVLASLVTPAVIYALVARFRGDPAPPIAEALRWGRRQWGKTLWNKFKVEVTIMLWGALLVIPGLVAMVKLIFTDQIVAIEGDRESEVLQRSRDITEGRRWLIFSVVLPVLIVELAGTYFILKAFQGSEYSRPLLAIVDSVLSVGGQWTNVVALLMYLGLTRER